jgi:hypothetical protein
VSAPDCSADLAFLELVANLARIIPTAHPSRLTAIGSGANILADRVVVKRAPDSCIYLHTWRRSDPDELHDHPWDSVSVVLREGYFEVTPQGRFWRFPGSVTFRAAEDRHRIEIVAGTAPVSLLITGPERREWGFHTGAGFVVGRDYRAGRREP